MGRPRNQPTPRRVPVTAPAAGANLSQTNDSGGTWVIRGVALTLTADANVASRFVTLAATAGEDVWFRTTVQLATTANQVRPHAAWVGAPPTTVDTGVTLIPWPEGGLWLPPGHILTSSVTAIQVGDQLSAIVLDVLEYPESLPLHFLPGYHTYDENDQE